MIRSAGLRAVVAVFRTAAGRLAAFLPFAAFGAGLLAGISCSSSKQVPHYRPVSFADANFQGSCKGRGIIPAHPRVYSVAAAVSPDFGRCPAGSYGKVAVGAACHPGCRRSTTTEV